MTAHTQRISIGFAKQQLHRIAKRYPSYAGMMRLKVDDGKTVHDEWAQMLRECEGIYLAEVVEEICNGQRDPVPAGEPGDRLPLHIRREANDRRAKATAKQMQEQMSEQTKNRSRARVVNPGFGARALKLRERLARGEINHGQHAHAR